MNKIVFFGDSYTDGENNNLIGISDYYTKGIVTKRGVSGSTIGEYSIYPVDGLSLISNLNLYKEDIINNDIIVLEFGINDITSLIMGNVSYNQIIISFVKALDIIKALNPNAKIHFLKLSDIKELLMDYARFHVEYLITDYMNPFLDSNIKEELALKWYNEYERLFNDINKKINVITMIDDKDFLKKYLSSDYIHPNDLGYRIISKTLEEKIG